LEVPLLVVEDIKFTHLPVLVLSISSKEELVFNIWLLEAVEVEEEDAVLLSEEAVVEELVDGNAVVQLILVHVEYKILLVLEEHLLLMDSLLVFTI
jgi:hypothetical protein